MDISLLKTQAGDVSAFFSGVYAFIKYLPVVFKTVAYVVSGGKLGDITVVTE